MNTAKEFQRIVYDNDVLVGCDWVKVWGGRRVHIAGDDARLTLCGQKADSPANAPVHVDWVLPCVRCTRAAMKYLGLDTPVDTTTAESQ